MQPPKPVDLWALSDLATPWCIYAAATLHLAEHIAAGESEICQLAGVTGCDPDALHAVLGHLVSRGIFIEPTPGQFALNDAANQLLDPVVQLSFNLDGIGGRFAGVWSTLLEYLHTATPAYQRMFGLPFWDDLAAHPDLAAQFDAIIGPPGHGMPDPEFEITGGWESIGTVVDVGGGTGAMLAEMLCLHPQLHGVLVDLPRTVARSAEIFSSAGVQDRVNLAGQSFFDPLPAGADIYLLRGVLNDWPDHEAGVILSRCAEAARAISTGRLAGRVVILKSVEPDGAPKDLTIEMLLVGGKHRDLSAFTRLAESAGLEVIAAGLQPSGYFVVECRPV